MSMDEMEKKARELRQLMRMQEEIEAEMEAIKDEIKAAMGDQEMVVAGEYKIMYKTVESVRLDTRGLKAALPEVAALFTVTARTKRFQVA